MSDERRDEEELAGLDTSDRAEPTESEEEAAERVRIVRARQIFGDTPTDPTIGDIDVPAHDEEAANVAQAEVDAKAEEGDEDAADLSAGEAKRQTELVGAEDAQEGAEEQVEGDTLRENDDSNEAAEAAEREEEEKKDEEADAS